MSRFHCHGCSKAVTSELPRDAIMRAVAWCPECIEVGKDQYTAFTADDVALIEAAARLFASGDAGFWHEQEKQANRLQVIADSIRENLPRSGGVSS